MGKNEGVRIPGNKGWWRTEGENKTEGGGGDRMRKRRKTTWLCRIVTSGEVMEAMCTNSKMPLKSFPSTPAVLVWLFYFLFCQTLWSTMKLHNIRKTLVFVRRCEETLHPRLNAFWSRATSSSFWVFICRLLSKREEQAALESHFGCLAVLWITWQESLRKRLVGQHIWKVCFCIHT